MHFLWSDMLWALLALPLLALAGWLVSRGRKRVRLRFSSLTLVREALGPGQRARRLLPPALLLVAMGLALLALARPSAVVTLPTDDRTIVLAIDVSLSMSATDIEPNRLVAAQSAARHFVATQPPDVAIAVVSFAGTASIVQAPTRNRDDVIAAIDRLLLDRHTAIGSAILMSLATLFPDQGHDLDQMIFGDWRDGPGDGAAAGGGLAGMAPFEVMEPGSYPYAAIILLTDGRSTTGPHPVEAARLAAERGVKVYTVGFGTTEGSTVTTAGWSMFMRFDEDALIEIADMTGAQYFHAGSAEDLNRVYQDLNARFVFELQETELSGVFALVAALLASLAGGLSLLWFNRAV